MPFASHIASYTTLKDHLLFSGFLQEYREYARERGEIYTYAF